MLVSMIRRILALSLMLCIAGLSGAFPTGDFAHMTSKRNKLQAFHDSIALYSPTPAEKSRIGGPDDLPVLALYFFRSQMSPEEKTAFGASIAANSRGIGAEYPYGILELALNPGLPLGPQAVKVFNTGRCTSDKSYGFTGAMLDELDQRSQWEVNLTKLTGELKDGAIIEYDLSFEHKASKWQAEFRGSAPLVVVANSRCHPIP